MNFVCFADVPGQAFKIVNNIKTLNMGQQKLTFKNWALKK